MICPHCGKDDGIRRFISQYTHVDGSRWAGPFFIADSLIAAQAAAMTYPMQPLEIVGELATVEASPDGIVVTGYPLPSEKPH